MRYWLHRISHEWEAAYPLLELGYLTIGWHSLMNTGLLERIQREGESAFQQATQGWERGRWSFWYFSQFQPGDIVVTPLFNKEFTVLRVAGRPFEITELAGLSFQGKNGAQITVRQDGLWDDQGFYELGFAVPVRPLKPAPLPRALADARLQSRMKMRQTNGEISDLAESVERALAAEGPASLHEAAVQAASAGLRQAVAENLSPNQLEQLVCWYMKKKGASRAWRPAPNERGKENGADADVIAEFDDLGVIFYIQVKKHQGLTGDWAVRQISQYAQQKRREDDYTYIPWVISTADFSKEAVQSAKAEGVRLIGGGELARMLLDCGLEQIDQAF